MEKNCAHIQGVNMAAKTKICCGLLSAFLLAFPIVNFSSTPVKSVVIFGDSLSDIGNTTHLLKSFRRDEDPAFLVAPFKHFVINKMIDNIKSINYCS